MSRLRETDLYPPLKAFLEAQGYEVKSEVTGADVVALRDDDADPLIVEMKTGMNLTLVQQGVARQALTDWVYLAVPTFRGRKALAGHVALCRRLGLGFITIRPRDGFVEVHCDPGPYAPRQSRPPSHPDRARHARRRPRRARRRSGSVRYPAPFVPVGEEDGAPRFAQRGRRCGPQSSCGTRHDRNPALHGHRHSPVLFEEARILLDIGRHGRVNPLSDIDFAQPM